MDCYILRGKTAVPAADLDEWGQWFETTNRVVAQTRVANGVEVSTVFLGRDHAFGGGEPLLFETLIFGGERDGEMWRYPNWKQARAGHDSIVAEFTHRCTYCGTLRHQDAAKCKSCGGNF